MLMLMCFWGPLFVWHSEISGPWVRAEGANGWGLGFRPGFRVFFKVQWCLGFKGLGLRV